MMLYIMQDDDRFVVGSAGIRVEQALVKRAIADADAGRPRSSESPAYSLVYASAARLHRTNAGNLILSMCLASKCIDCGHEGDLEYGGAACACSKPDQASLQFGMLAVIGVDSTHDEARFMTNSQLRELTDTGFRIERFDGEDITHEVQSIH